MYAPRNPFCLPTIRPRSPVGGARPIAVIVAMLAVALLLGALAAPAAALSAARPTTEPGSDGRPGVPGEGPGRTVEAPDPFSGLGIGGFDGFEVDEFWVVGVEAAVVDGFHKQAQDLLAVAVEDAFVILEIGLLNG